MMKKLSKALLSLALVLAMLFSFTGCFNNSIDGEWKAELTMAQLCEMIGNEMDEADTLLVKEAFGSVTIGLTFTADEEKGEATLALAEKEGLADKLTDAYMAFLADGGLYKIYELQGQTREDVDQMLAESNMTYDQAVEMLEGEGASLADSFTESFDDAETTDSYEFEKGKGEFGDFTLELDGKTLKLSKDDAVFEFTKQ